MKLGPKSLENAITELCSFGKELKEIRKEGLKVSQFPLNMHLPEGSKSIDMRNVFNITKGTRETLIDFKAPTGGSTVITHFGIFNDGLLASEFDFFPTIDRKRIYTFHGDPLDNFRIYLGVGPDLSNLSLFHAPITMQPGQRLRWEAENRSAVDTDMGVRVVGYFTRTEQRRQVQWGG